MPDHRRTPTGGFGSRKQGLFSAHLLSSLCVNPAEKKKELAMKKRFVPLRAVAGTGRPARRLHGRWAPAALPGLVP